MPTDNAPHRSVNSGVRGSGVRSNVAGPVCGVLIGLALIACAIPRILAYSAIAPWSGLVPVALAEGLPIDEPSLIAARASYATALKWQTGSADIAQSYVFLSMRLPESTRNEAGDAVQFLPEPLRVLKQSAAAAPGASRTWGMLAKVEQRAAAPVSEYADYLRLSASLAPYEVSSVITRVDTMMRVVNELPDDLAAFAKRDVRTLWMKPYLRKFLVGIYLDQDFSGRAAIRRLAFDDVRDGRHFDRMLLEVLNIGPNS
tara:strand:+ start:3780 stop:4553 length:774 start_codon:yes stop_codon:yes gene_type:complete